MIMLFGFGVIIVSLSLIFIFLGIPKLWAISISVAIVGYSLLKGD